MKAAVSARYGPPEVVRLTDIEMPAIGPREVLVKVFVSTVNRTDSGFRAGHPWFARVISGVFGPKAKVLGCEFAGVITALGSGVTNFAIGDRVFGFSEFRYGAHAEYLSMPAEGSIALIPDGLTFDQVAPATEGSHYALSLIDHAQVSMGQSVLVYGATGAIGSAAVQLLKQRGARITAVCGTAHLELVRGLGADRVVDYTTTDFTKDAQTYDVVIDAVGKSSFVACQPLLTPQGIFLSGDLGPWSQNLVLPLATRWRNGKQVMFPLPPRHDKAGTEYLRDLLATGAFRPVIDRSFALDDIVDAYRYVETERKVGNVLIRVANEPL
jgi:NADPH:quinone reductase-like Zn-dependent oxidoreductase